MKKRVLRTLKRIRNARIIFVCNTYIDYIEPSEFTDKHRFAHINKDDFEADRFDQLGGELEENLRWGTPIDLVIETREVPPFEGKGKLQKCDFLIDIQNMNW